MSDVQHTAPVPCRPRRRFRRETPRPMVLTERDAAVVERVFLCRAVPAQATFLFARTFDPGAGGDNWSKRLRLLYDSGWISRFYLPQSQYLSGSQWPIYCVESGVAARASELRRSWRAIDKRTRARITAASCTTRDQVLRLLAGRGFEPDAVNVGLRASTDLALKVYSGEPCHIQHVLLTATINALLWYSLTEAPQHVAADGGIDLSDSADDPLLPDSFFVVGRTAVCIEAETGTSNRAKIRAKVTRYLSVRARLDAIGRELGVPIDRLRVVFHCASAGHKRLVAELIAEQAPHGTSRFLLSDSTYLHLDFPQVYFRRNAPVAFGEGEAERPFYDALKTLSQRAVFAQVEGQDAGAARLGFLSFAEAIAR